MIQPPLLAVDALKVHFPIRKGLLQRTVGHVRAVDALRQYHGFETALACLVDKT